MKIRRWYRYWVMDWVKLWVVFVSLQLLSAEKMLFIIFQCSSEVHWVFLSCHRNVQWRHIVNTKTCCSNTEAKFNTFRSLCKSEESNKTEAQSKYFQRRFEAANVRIKYVNFWLWENLCKLKPCATKTKTICDRHIQPQDLNVGAEFLILNVCTNMFHSYCNKALCIHSHAPFCSAAAQYMQEKICTCWFKNGSLVCYLRRLFIVVTVRYCKSIFFSIH